MATKRKYRCSDCGLQFEYTHIDKHEPLLQDCPNLACASNAVAHDIEAERAEGEERIRRMVESGIPPGVSTNKSIALKHAEKAMESMGMTDFNDSGRVGERAAKAPTPPQTSEAEAMTREMVQAGFLHNEQQAEAFKKGASTFWTHNDPAQKSKLAEVARVNPLAAAVQRAPMVAPGAAAIARQMDRDPIKLLHDGEKKSGGLRHEVVAAVRG